MAIRINSQVNALRSTRRIAATQLRKQEIFERLSSGMRLVRAKDGAAELSISKSLHLRSRISTQAVRNVNDGINVLNVAEGALIEIARITQRQMELAEQSANGIYSGRQRIVLNGEAQELNREINRIVSSTSFNGFTIFGEVRENGLRLQAGFGLEESLFMQIGERFALETGTGTFQATASSVPLAGSASPLGTELADMNGDGNLDLITTDFASTNIGISLGNGDGTFGARTNFGGGFSQQYTVEAADFNGDGDQDLLVASDNGNRMSVFLGNGDGTIGAASAIVNVPNIRQAIVADLNGDGNTDIVSANLTGGSITYALGNGTGTFGSPVTIAGPGGGAQPQSVAVGDFNSDGVQDIASGNAVANTVSVYFGTTPGNFSSGINIYNTAGSDPRNIVSGDFDNDNDIDIAVALQSTDEVVILRNGSGTFSEGQRITVDDQPRGLQSADINGDGQLDLVARSIGVNDRFSVMLGSTNGTFASPAFYNDSAAGSNGQNFRLGDVNNDGALDIVGADIAGGTASVLLGTAGTSVSAEIIDIRSQVSARSALDILSSRLNRVNFEIGEIGGFGRRLEAVVQTLKTSTENFEAAKARIENADIAQEAASLVQHSIVENTAAQVLQSNREFQERALQIITDAEYL